MLTIRYEDREIIVVEKPQGIEAQSSRSFEPDMVSLIQNHIAGREGRDTHKISTNLSTNWGKHSTKPVQKQPPYVAVIHRLDRPVAGIMVYAKTKKAAAALSSQVKEGKMEKTYYAVICGKPVDFVGNYVDYLRKNGKTNRTEIVDKEAEGGKRAELAYQVVETITREQELSLVRIRLLTGRHHQIRVQFAGRGMPLWGIIGTTRNLPWERLGEALPCAPPGFLFPILLWGKRWNTGCSLWARHFPGSVKLIDNEING